MSRDKLFSVMMREIDLDFSVDQLMNSYVALLHDLQMFWPDYRFSRIRPYVVLSSRR